MIMFSTDDTLKMSSRSFPHFGDKSEGLSTTVRLVKDLENEVKKTPGTPNPFITKYKHHSRQNDGIGFWTSWRSRRFRGLQDHRLPRPGTVFQPHHVRRPEDVRVAPPGPSKTSGFGSHIGRFFGASGFWGSNCLRM